jgi:hypothetical protein
MTLAMSFHFGDHLSDQKDVRFAVPIPMVYENVQPQPARWEYRVLIIDTREEDLPTPEQLNELGNQGWLLVGILDQGRTGRSGFDTSEATRHYIDNLLEHEPTGRSSLVQYYFVRQRQE